MKRLNLDKCKNEKIDISIPVNINNNDNIDIYNKSSSYYNDLCSITDSKRKVDITIKDRQNEFINNNMTLCEDNCDLIAYNYTNKKAKCSCAIKISVPLLDDIKLDKNKLKNQFTDIDNTFNIKIMKCYENVFKFNNLIKNFGFYFQINIFIIYFIILLLFCCKYYNLYIKKIKKIIDNKQKKNTLNKNNNEKETQQINKNVNK